MELIEKYRQEYRQHQASKAVRRSEQEADALFQIAEYDDQLWLTFGGSKVCPCDMLKDEPVEAVKKMRELYIKQNLKK